MCGLHTIGARRRPSRRLAAANTAATRASAASNTFSHDWYAIGMPPSVSHSHSGSSPPCSPSTNSRIRSAGPIVLVAALPVRPLSSRQVSRRVAPLPTFVTVSLPGSRS